MLEELLLKMVAQSPAMGVIAFIVFIFLKDRTAMMKNLYQLSELCHKRSESNDKVTQDLTVAIVGMMTWLQKNGRR
ncbi:hypothetical protein LCGC14_1764710 [marine sediment metagenome]|uniref:Uncharacterized protein n=1 Tax=marine sediment metagenome TaxID=412755 RepID=A0A0F9JZQ0_9ZZZZ